RFLDLDSGFVEPPLVSLFSFVSTIAGVLPPRCGRPRRPAGFHLSCGVSVQSYRESFAYHALDYRLTRKSRAYVRQSVRRQCHVARAGKLCSVTPSAARVTSSIIARSHPIRAFITSRSERKGAAVETAAPSSYGVLLDEPVDLAAELG